MAASNTVSMGWRLVFRSLQLRMRRVLMVFAALSMGAAIITAMAGVYFDINEKMSRELRNYGANFFVGPGQESYFSEALYQRIRQQVPADTLVAASPYLYGMTQSDLEKVVLMGVDFTQLRRLVPYWQVRGQWIDLAFDQRNAMIGSKLAEKLELRLGSTLDIIRGSERRSLTIKGIVESGADEDNYLIVNLPLAQQWLGRGQQVNYAMFSLTNANGQVEQLAKTLRQSFPELDIRPIRKVSAAEGKVLDKIKLLMGVVAVVILVLATLCVNTTLTAMIGERRHEFALQKALGASHRAITRQILWETLLMTLASILAGLLLGYLLAQVLGQSVFNARIEIRPPVFFITSTLSFIAAMVAATVPTLKAVSVDPARVLKGD